jgi:hypothetical protein
MDKAGMWLDRSVLEIVDPVQLQNDMSKLTSLINTMIVAIAIYARAAEMWRPARRFQTIGILVT